MAARAISTASISFGLVSIPVKFFTTAQSSSAIRFNQIAPDGARVKQQYVSARSGEVVDRKELRKGFEFAKGQYVVLEADELKALETTASYTIDIKEFVPLKAVDRLLTEKSYFLGPDKGGAKAYHLLREAMEDTGLVAIAKYAARGKDYLVMVRPKEDGLILDQLYYADEVRSLADIPTDPIPVEKSELKLARQLIEQIASDSFDHAAYRDEVKDEIMALIEKKVAGEEITMAVEDESETKIIDLMAALKASLDTEDRKQPKRAAKKTASKKTAKKTTAKRKASGGK